MNINIEIPVETPHRPQPESCPKFENCSAPLCPLDAGLEHRVYCKGEAVCKYALEYVAGGVPEYEPTQQAIVDAVEETLPTMERIGGANFRDSLKRAQKRAMQKVA